MYLCVIVYANLIRLKRMILRVQSGVAGHTSPRSRL